MPNSRGPASRRPRTSHAGMRRVLLASLIIVVAVASTHSAHSATRAPSADAQRAAEPAEPLAAAPSYLLPALTCIIAESGIIVLLLISRSVRRRAEVDLVRSEQNYRALVEINPNAVLVHDGNLILYANPAAVQLFGADSTGKLIGTPILDRAVDASRDLVRSRIQRVLREREVAPLIEIRVCRLDGSVVDVEATASPCDFGGRPAIQALLRDITERKRAAEALAQSAANLRLMLDHSPAAVAMFDTQMRYIAFSRRWLADYRLGDVDLTGRSHYEVFPEIPERWKEIHRRCLAGAIERCDEDLFTRLDGSVDWVRWEIRPWHNDRGEIGGVMLFTEVLTERKRVEAALRSTEERYQSVVARVGVIAWEADAATMRFTYVHGAPGSLLGYTVEQWCAPNFWVDHLHPDDRDAAIAFCRAQTLGGKSHVFEYRMIAADGRVVWIHDTVEVDHAPGDPLRVYGVMIDTSATHRAEEQRDRLFESAFDLMAEITPDGRFRRVNPALARTLGRDATELVGRPVLELTHPDDHAAFAAALTAATSGGGVVAVEVRARARDGSTRWIHGRLSYSADDNVTYGIGRDVTDTRRRDRLLEQTNAVAEIGGWELDFLTGNLYWTEQTHRIHEVDPAEYVPTLQTALSFYAPGSREIIARTVERAMQTGEPWDLELELITARGNRIWVRAVGRVQFEEGRPARAFGAFANITLRKRMELSLERERAVLERLVRLLQSLSRAIERPAVLRVVREAVLDLCGAPAVIGVLRDGDSTLRIDPDLTCASSLNEPPESYLQHAERCAADRRPLVLANGKVSDGDPAADAEIAFVPIRSADPMGAMGVHWSNPRPISETDVQTLQAVADAAAVALENAALYAQLVAARADAEARAAETAILYDEAQREVQRRKAAEDALRAAHDELEARVVQRTAALQAANRAMEVEYAQRRRAEEQVRRHLADLAHVARVSLMGELATGIAHELNQPLAALTNYARGCLLRMKSGELPDNSLQAALKNIAEQSARAGEIVRRLQRFVRRREPAFAALDVNRLVRESVELSRPGVLEKVDLRLQLADDLPPVQGDDIQIEQILMNLIRNGCEAMADVPAHQRQLTIETAQDEAGGVRLLVHDRGCGIPTELLERVFESFYTTKPDGLGMGLSISRSIAEAHGGVLRAMPRPGGGTTFCLTLPRGVAIPTNT